MQLGGLHHVSAVTTDVSANVAFYTQVLGLRLVKKSVNQDDVSAYHLFYGDEIGRPGTEITFFDWPQLVTAPNRAGAGEISAVTFRVTGREALDWWARRFEELGVAHGEIEEKVGRAALSFFDPEGQRLRLVDDSGGETPGGTPWEGSSTPERVGIRGLAAVDLTVRQAEPTARVLTDVLGFRKSGEYPQGGARVVVFEIGAGGPGAEVRLIERPSAPPAWLGRGGVHHVAFRTHDEKEQVAWREQIEARGLWVTPVVDRHYFRSVYFREPNGILFEIATDGPGFLQDEDAEHLGEKLSLPPFLEHHRERIEKGLRPLHPVGEQVSAAGSS